MINFNQDIACEFIEALEHGNSKDVQHVFRALVIDAQADPSELTCQKVDGSPCCEYNDRDSAIEGLKETLATIATGVQPHSEVWGVLVPRFFCIASRLVKESTDGESGSEPVPEDQD